MIRLTGILVLAYGLLLQIVFAAEYNMDAFNLGLESFTEDSSIVAYCREFVENAEDIDVIREAQNKWNRIDKDNALEYFAALAEVNPESPKYLYLKGRIVPSKLEQVELGRKVISLDEDWSYGYRLLLAGYVTGLFDKRGNSVEKQTLAEELEKDEHQFSKLIEIDGEEDYSLRFMRSYHFYKENYTAVIDVLDKAAVLNADWVNPYEYARVYFEMGNYDKTLSEITRHVDEKITAGEYLPVDRQKKIDGFYTSLLRTKKMYAEIIKHYEGTPDFKTNDVSLFSVARIYALLEDSDKAFEYLFAAAENGWGRVETTQKSRDLDGLKEDPRWEEVIQGMEKAWEEGEAGRYVETLASRMKEDAYNWTLTTTEGDSIRLSDLEGSIVILDFWATWCGPCMSAMPVIDEWFKTEKPDNVKVFSVNIWERDLDKARTTMTDNNYSMQLLYGNDRIADAYGIESIPYICAIDTEGNIRFEEKGYSQGLRELLGWWVKDMSN